MLRIGITGGIGSGKSTVAKMFETLGVPVLILPIHGPVEGRLALGVDGEKPRLILTRRAVTTWCAENGVPFQAFKRELMEAKVLRTSLPGVDMRTGVVRAALGKGVVGYTQLGAAPCLELDPEAGARAVSPHTETVIRLHAG